MTIQSQTTRVDYTGNGATTNFPVPFYWLQDADLLVIRTDNAYTPPTVATLALGTDYVVTGSGNQSGGSITTTVAPTATQKLSILRNVPFTQLTHYVPNDPFPAASHEQALDKLTMETQQLNEGLNRSLTLPPNVTGVSTALPTPVPNNFIGWNQAATALQNVDPATLVTIVAFSTWQADKFSGDGSTRNFILTASPGNQANLDVSIGGVTQRAGIDFTWTSGTTLSFTTAPPAGTSNILVRYGQALPQSASDIGASTLYGQAGTDLFKANVNRVVDSVATLKTLDKTRFTRAFVTGYYAPGDGGGGTYYYDTTDTTSTDNGGTIIVASDGGRWKLVLTGDVSVRQFGAKADNTTNDVTAFQNAVTWLMNTAPVGGTLFVPDGTYKIVGQITQDRSSNTGLGVVNICGAGRTSVTINHSGATALFSVTGHPTAVEGQTKDIRISGMTLLGASTVGQTALGLTLVSFPHFEDLHIEGFDYAGYFQDVDHCSFDACVIRFNLHGLFTRKNPSPVANSTMPNQYTFNEVHFGNNSLYGAFNGGGSDWAFSGGSFETNGGGDSVNGYGLRCDNCAYEGGAVVTCNGTYFESNNGLADVVLVQTITSSLVSATYNFEGCSFNRASSTLIATNVMLTNFDTVANVGLQIVNLIGCTFKSLGSYTPSGARPYLNWSGAQNRTSQNFNSVGTLYEDAVESPSQVQRVGKPFLECSKSANQTINNSTPTVWQLDTVGAGYSWSTSINGSFQVPIPETGNYLLTASVTFSATPANTSLIEILKGSFVIGNNATAGTNVLTVSCNKYCTAGELIYVRVTQNSGSAATLVGSSSAVSYLNMNKLADA